MENFKSKFEEEYEENLRKALADMPALMVSDCAKIVKEITDRVCDEYIAKGDAYTMQFCMSKVKDFMKTTKEIDKTE